MQEVEKTVDIDTSGPDTEVELNQEEISDTTAVESTETSSAEPVEPVAEEKTIETKSEEKEEKKDELKEYSEGVQRRIAKLTKKWREAERQKEEAA